MPSKGNAIDNFDSLRAMVASPKENKRLLNSIDAVAEDVKLKKESYKLTLECVKKDEKNILKPHIDLLLYLLLDVTTPAQERDVLTSWQTDVHNHLCGKGFTGSAGNLYVGLLLFQKIYGDESIADDPEMQALLEHVNNQMHYLTHADKHDSADIFAAKLKAHLFTATVVALLITAIVVPIAIGVVAFILPMLVPAIPTVMTATLIAGLPSFSILALIGCAAALTSGVSLVGLSILPAIGSRKQLDKAKQMKQHNKGIDEKSIPTMRAKFEDTRSKFFKSYESKVIPGWEKESSEADIWKEALHRLEHRDFGSIKLTLVA